MYVEPDQQTREVALGHQRDRRRRDLRRLHRANGVAGIALGGAAIRSM
jgi:hypothetical protein